MMRAREISPHRGEIEGHLISLTLWPGKPQVVLLDEATSALSAEAALEIFALLRRPEA